MENMIDIFNKKFNEVSSIEGLTGIDRATEKRKYMPVSEEKNEERLKSTDYLQDDVTLTDIKRIVKNKKLSNNKIKSEIKKLLKNPEELTEFLKSFIKKTENKESDTTFGDHTVPVGGVIGSRNEGKTETKEVTASGGGVGAYEGPALFGKIKEEKFKGGKADNKNFTDLVKKYKNKTRENLKLQLTKGIKVEMEHTNNKETAKEIALDHLFEDPNYYTKLKKVETKEATSTASSGAYEGPSIWAKTTSKKNWKPSRKTQIPGGKFVQVKKKCKRFPYCNQGDIKALNIFENEVVKDIIEKVSDRYNLHEDHIKDIILYELRKTGKL